MGSLFSRLTLQTARSYGLVLTAMGIPYTTEYNSTYWSLTVDTRHRRQAIRAVHLYLQENPPRPASRPGPPLPGKRSFSALYVAAILGLVHAMIVPGYEYRVFISALGADAAKIIDGDIFRCVTALLLHADWAHLLGNIAALSLFGTVVAVLYGWGMGWLLILASGATGNLMTAVWYQHHHLAVGASTAVFGAVGLCAVMSAYWRARAADRSWRSWVPLAGGLALLGFMGTSPQSDLAAHLFGFLCGLGAGWLDLRFRRYRKWPLQLIAAGLAIATISGCWLWGVLYSG